MDRLLRSVNGHEKEYIVSVNKENVRWNIS